MKKGDFAIIDKSSEEILFRYNDVDMTKVEFIVRLTPFRGGMATDIMRKATGL